MEWLENIISYNYQFQWQVIWKNLPMFLKGIGLSFRLTILAIFFGSILGTVGALGRRSGNRIISTIFLGYVHIMRNTPLIVQLFFIYFGLTSLNLFLDPNTAALVALSIHAGGYLTEVIRAGIESVERRQVEAGLSLGMSYFQTFRYIILFPSVKAVFPSLGNEFILIFLSSSVLSQISAEELTYYGFLLESRTFRSFEIFFTIALIYLIISQILSLIMKLINKYVFIRHREEL